MNIDLYSYAWYLAGVVWCLAIAEFIGMHLFLKPVYMSGLKIYSQISDLPHPQNENIELEIVTMDEGKFKFISSDECLFTSKWHFCEFRLRTPFPIKGRVIWTEKGSEINGRIPIGTTLFFLFWLVGWTAGPFYGMETTYLITGWLLIAVIIAISIPAEKKRMEEMIEELKLILMTKKVLTTGSTTDRD